MVFTYDSVKRLLEKSASKQNRWSKYASMVALIHPQHMLAFRFACICKRRQGWWEGSVHNTSHQDQQQSNLLPLGHMKSPHGRTWKGENDDIQDNSKNSNEDCPRKEIVVFRTIRIIFLIGMIYCPLAIKRRDGGQKDGQACHVGDYQGSQDGVYGVSEPFALGECAQVQHQNCRFDETDDEKIARVCGKGGLFREEKKKRVSQVSYVYNYGGRDCRK